MALEKVIGEFAAYVRTNELQIEGIAVGDENRVILEERFTADLPRNTYSHTKSFMTTAVGIARSEGKLSLEDRLVDAFPECVPEHASEGLEQIRLKHLLTMSSGFHGAFLMGEDRRAGVGAPDYVAYMMRQKVVQEPGTEFTYSSADSILAGRMVEKAVGRRLGEYLYERIFSRMGLGWPVWENDYQGHPVGCGGMYLRLTEMMRLGQLYLTGGVWKGERLVDADWVKEATAKQIETEANGDVWSCGYGYQFWMSPYPGAYRADGAYGQITTVLPEPGLVVSVQCPETGNFDKVKRALHEIVLTQM